MVRSLKSQKAARTLRACRLVGFSIIHILGTGVDPIYLHLLTSVSIYINLHQSPDLSLAPVGQRFGAAGGSERQRGLGSNHTGCRGFVV